MSTEVRIPVRQVAGPTSEATIRTHRVLIDRPEAKGGSDAGPMGGELFVAAVGGCFMSNLIAAIRARNAPITNAQTEVIGTADGTPLRFVSFELIVTAETDDREMLEKCVEIAERGCIMLNTLRDKLEYKVTIAAPVAA
jgi:putative redox protein